ncbi:helix-turn-helix domain-containing protein [Micromonospora sp. CPCC 206061]|uniref:helix-turn-helix domain-containing protein n=1 Tax=Micromonospora sp. CPCC 206061 TaxID=3122410 RepID=UPI002FF00758
MNTTGFGPGDFGVGDVTEEAGFAQLLRSLRERACLTQEQLAERSDVSIRAISDLERGRTKRPRHRSVALLAEALRIEGDQLERFRRLARRRVRTEPLRVVPSGGGVRSLAPPPSAPPSQHVLERLGEVMAQIFVEEPARLEQAAGPTRRPSRVVELVGAPGSGTTAVAVHVASLLRQHFPDGQFYVDACSNDPTSFLLRLARVLGITAETRATCSINNATPAGAETARDWTSRLRYALHTHRALLVLDNVADGACLRPILPAIGMCALIVITPRRLALCDGVWTIDVPDFDEALLLAG